MDITSTTLDRLQKSYINSFKLGAANGNSATFQDAALKNQFKNHFLKLCEMEQTKTNKLRALLCMQSTSLDEFDKMYKKACDDLQADPQQIAKYKKFADEIDNIVVLDGTEAQNTCNVTMVGDDMEVQETQNLIDPISKTQIRDPVKNTICGHIYERNSIIGALRLNHRTRCAYMGCANRKPITLNCLQDDYMLKAKLDLMFYQMDSQDMD